MFSQIFHNNMNLVIFDLDGTLVNVIEEADYFCAFNRTLVHHGLSPISKEEYFNLDLWNLEGYDGVDLVLKQLSPHLDARPFFDIFDKYYPLCAEHAIENGEMFLFDDVMPTFRKLKEVKCLIAILTNTGRPGAELKLEKLGLSPFIDSLKTKNECEPKPNPEGLHMIVDELSVAIEKALFVGDSSNDEKAAQKAGIRFIRIDRQSHELTTGKVKSLTDIIKFL